MRRQKLARTQCILSPRKMCFPRPTEQDGFREPQRRFLREVSSRAAAENYRTKTFPSDSGLAGSLKVKRQDIPRFGDA